MVRGHPSPAGIHRDACVSVPLPVLARCRRRAQRRRLCSPQYHRPRCYQQSPRRRRDIFGMDNADGVCSLSRLSTSSRLQRSRSPSRHRSPSFSAAATQRLRRRANGIDEQLDNVGCGHVDGHRDALRELVAVTKLARRTARRSQPASVSALVSRIGSGPERFRPLCAASTAPSPVSEGLVSFIMRRRYCPSLGDWHAVVERCRPAPAAPRRLAVRGRPLTGVRGAQMQPGSETLESVLLRKQQAIASWPISA